jgi:hypothetical protein
MRMKRPTVLVPLGRNRTSYRCNCARGGNGKKQVQTVEQCFL